MELFKTTNGRTYAIRFRRLVIYIDRHGVPSLRHGGIMVNRCGTRKRAKFLGWRFAWSD